MATFLEISLIDAEPPASDFTSLTDYNSSTPAAFSLETDPVLHYELPNASLQVLSEGLLKPDGLQQLPSEFSVRAKVASSRLFLWAPELNFGYSIPYPSITLHGITDGPAIYLQLAVNNLSGDGIVELNLIPLGVEDLAETVREVYKALCDCSDLHADPASEDEGQGVALNFDMASGLEGVNGGDDDGWTVCVQDESEEHEVNGKAGLEVEIDEETVHAGSRRRRSQDESEQNGDVNDKWRRTL